MQTHIYTLPSAATMTKTKIILINKLFNQFLLFANITTVSTPTLECVYLRIYIEYFVNNSSMSVVLVNWACKFRPTKYENYTIMDTVVN